MLYRANQLKGVSPADMEKLAALGLKNDFDLRTAAERDEAPDELPPGVNNVWLNVLADAKGGLKPAEVFRVIGDPERANDMLGGGKTETVMRETYRDFIRLPSANAAFRQLFTTLGEGGSSPALFHCTAGKDRTGWAAAALLTLLGVPKETVIQDYLRSNDYILPMYQQAMDDFVARGGEPDILPALFGVKAEYLEVTFDEMQKRYGTMERYFSEGLGINAAKQKALRAVFLTTR
jgi:protein-tyrosine phosphatase